ncbi:phosphopantetheine-binding protein [Kitasatospora sp. NBC_00085]|uniref:phosphopantetheine-binding protein n=1 Tax=unclassified Kitasatospora TaxID=2633591 RepID=UPI0032519730
MNGHADEQNPVRSDGTQAGATGGDLSALVLALAHELLERTDVRADEDFFSAGGDSILAMHLVGQLARRTGLKLRVSLLFANPVLRDFAAEVEQLRAAATAAAAAPAAAPAVPLAAALSAARATDGSAASAS